MRRQMLVNARRLRIKVEGLSHAREKRHQHRDERQRDLYVEVIPSFGILHDDDPAMPVDLDAWNGVSPQAVKQRAPVEGRAVGQRHAQHSRIHVRARGLIWRPAHSVWRHSVAFLKYRVESAQTLKSARVGYTRHRQRGVGKELLREQKTVCERELHRRYAKLAFARPAEMPLAHTELVRELRDTVAIQR